MTNAIIFTPPRWRGFWLLFAAFLLGGWMMP
jgi:hypothetical protein